VGDQTAELAKCFLGEGHNGSQRRMVGVDAGRYLGLHLPMVKSHDLGQVLLVEEVVE
jgi:hypothetical protein